MVKSYNRKGLIREDETQAQPESESESASTPTSTAPDAPDAPDADPEESVSDEISSEASEDQDETELEPAQLDEDGDGHDDRNGRFVDGNQEASASAS
jgi:hypothetical protein